MLVSLAAFAATLLWGQGGHRAVARVALDYLTPTAHAAVLALAGSDSAFVAAANWADEIRPLLPETGPWHYVNVPVDSAGYVRARDCPTGDCVIEVIGWFRKVVADSTAPRAARTEALWYLVHFVADLHQPLHVSDHGDRGGNDVHVELSGRETNLHWVWDSGLLDWAGIRGSALDAEVARRAAALPDATVDVEAWAAESHDLARDRVYRVKEGDTVTGLYASQGVEIVLDRMARAARRLAALLNAAFDPAPLPPAR